LTARLSGNLNARLSTRLLLNTTAALLLTGALAWAVYAAALYWGTDLLFRRELRGNAERVAAGLRFDAAGALTDLVLEPRFVMLYDALPRDYTYRILDGGGRVVRASGGARQPYLPADGVQRPGEWRMVASGLPLRVLTLAVTAPGCNVQHPARGAVQSTAQGGAQAAARCRYYVQSGRSERFQQIIDANDERTSHAVGMGAAALAMLAFCAVVWSTFRRMLAPLRQVSAAAAGITPEALAVRLSSAGLPSEILPLIGAFNAALDRLEHGYRVQQDFLATAAHELKTPLTLMRAQLEIDGLAEPALLLQDVARMSRQVQQLLNLAECSERQNYVFEAVDASAIAADVAAHLDRLVQHRQVSIMLVADAPPAPLRADSGALFLLLKNLLENAIHHAAAGQTVDIVVTQDGIAVRDRGPGIAPDDMPHLFQRYWRGAHRRDDGAGLGLAICREIALAHGWTLDARNRDAEDDRSAGSGTPAAGGAQFLLRFTAPA
jgi:signal transduction histidine kinase